VRAVRRILFSSAFVPPEWISAHALEPVRLVPRGEQDSGPISDREGICPFVRAFVNEACAEADAAGVVLTTTCDPMRRAADTARQETDVPIFLLGVPATWQTPTAHAYYRSELERLSRFLVRVGGSAPSPDELSRHLLEEDERSRARPEARPDATSTAGIPVALVGGPLGTGDLSLIAAIEDAGGRIVLDGTEEGERARRAPFDRRQLRDDPLGTLADAYFGAIPDAFRRPNSMLYAWLKDRIVEREVRGGFLLRYVWCDLWHAEMRRLQEWLEVPLVELDLSGEPIAARNLVRVQAFLEGLRA